MHLDAHLSKGGSPCFAISLCDKVLDFGDTILHLWKEVAFSNIPHHVLVNLVWVIIATKLL